MTIEETRRDTRRSTGVVRPDEDQPLGSIGSRDARRRRLLAEVPGARLLWPHRDRRPARQRGSGHGAVLLRGAEHLPRQLRLRRPVPPGHLRRHGSGAARRRRSAAARLLPACGLAPARRWASPCSAWCSCPAWAWAADGNQNWIRIAGQTPPALGVPQARARRVAGSPAGHEAAAAAQARCHLLFPLVPGAVVALGLVMLAATTSAP